MNRIKNNQSGFSVVEIVMIVVIIGLIGAVGYLVFKNHSKNTKNVSSTQNVKTSTQSSTKSTVTNANIIKFPELGVEITVPESIKDITYSSVNTPTFPQGLSGTIINLSTDSLTKLDKECSNTGMAPPLGALSKVNGQYPKNPTVDNSAGQLVKQYPDYYIGFSGPQAACSSVDSTSNVALSDLGLLKSSLSTINLIQ